MVANLKFSETQEIFDEAIHYSRLIRHPHAEGLLLNYAIFAAFHSGDFEKAIETAQNSANLSAQANQIHQQMWATSLKLLAQRLLNVSTADTSAQMTNIVAENKDKYPYLVNYDDDSLTQMIIDCIDGKDTTARAMWQRYLQYGLSPINLIQVFAIEAIIHIRTGANQFAATLIGHLATYGNDVVGWLKRWQLYPDSVAQLKSRLDAATYQKAYQHGQSLTLDEMVRELKINTGMTVD
jgi:hypothetical protein